MNREEKWASAIAREIWHGTPYIVRIILHDEYMHAIQRNQIHGIRSCVADIEVRRNGRYVMPGIYRKRGGRAPKGSRRITLSWNFAGCLACPYHSRAINFIPVLKDILSTPAITTTICHHISAVSVRDVRREEERGRTRTLGPFILFIFGGIGCKSFEISIFYIDMYIDHGCKEKVARMDLKKFILHVKKKKKM